MKSIVLSACALLILFTSCNTSKKTNETHSKDQTPEMSMTKEPVSIENIKWKLVTLMGQDVSDKEAFITFSSEDHRVYGDGSCNTFNGTYQLQDGGRITISKIAATLKACVDMQIENQFMGVLEKADNFSLSGTKMTLNKARMAPLAVFEVAEIE
ncbi:META domain-containing protein [Mariniflexile sp. AS56]|uniref:META domain-containing protein n=1 Tax=Mariniflexile sp. AS56 TaxID=3063957 RepID=UPI0026EDA1B8|nr:META domain-containing protein [Mariniflexile sp. AS56]MDO7172260.1 META domain-containing protein [Mariniflexile sp. AS56]